MSKTYRRWEPGQSLLFPPSPLDWVPEGHLSRFVLDMVTQLDLKAIFAYYEREARGYPPHHPQMMVGLLLYSYCVGVPSSRKIEKRCVEDVAFRVIAGNTIPDHTCISEFRRIHLTALAGLFLQILQLCDRAGLVKLGHVALDGTKIKADASKHKAMSYERMKQQEDALTKKVQELLAQAEAIDSAEDAAHGKGVRGDELPEDLRRAEDRLKKIRALRRELEAEAKAQAAAERPEVKEDADVAAVIREGKNVAAVVAAAKGGEAASAAPATAPSEQSAQQSDLPLSVPTTGESPVQAAIEPTDDLDPPPLSPEPLPTHQIPREKDDSPTGKAQRNFVDPESRIMKGADGFIQGYNAQNAVDSACQIIVALGVSNQSPDSEYFIPMLDRVVENCGRAPEKTSADAWYFSENNIVRANHRGLDVYVATGRMKHGKAGEAPPAEAANTEKARMRAKLATAEGRAVYKRRKAIVEPVFGQQKNRGYRQFLLTGITKVRGEWALIGLSHNMLKLYQAKAA